MRNGPKNTGIWLPVCAVALFAMIGRTVAGEQYVFPQGTSEREDARLPAGVKLYWGEEPTEPLSAKRGRICLNGIWEFVPMLDKTETEPPAGMAYIHVPGSWKPSWPMPGLASESGNGPAWENWGDGSKTWCAWYRRKIKIPAQWAGRAILVCLERVSTDAIVYVNGVMCGAIAWPYSRIFASHAGGKLGPWHRSWRTSARASQRTVMPFDGRPSKRRLKARGSDHRAGTMPITVASSTVATTHTGTFAGS